jgi:hypothetical protein
MASNVYKLKFLLLHREVRLINLAITRFKNKWPFNTKLEIKNGMQVHPKLKGSLW